MNKIVIEFGQTDDELKSALEEYFPNNHEVYEHKGLDGGLEFFVAIITTLDFSMHCIEFFTTYFARKKNGETTKGGNNEKDTHNNKIQRVIVTPKGKISIEGYSGEDVKKILEGLKS